MSSTTTTTATTTSPPTTFNTKKTVRGRAAALLPPFLEKFEAVLKESKSGFLVGDGLTIVDFDLSLAMYSLSKDNYDFIESSAMIEKCPAIKAHMKKMLSLESVTEWFKQEQKGDGSDLTKKGLELVYFNFAGRAEPIRILCKHAGVTFRDVRLSGEQFAAMKKDGSLPYGQLPVLFVDGVPLAQTSAILRYVGNISKTPLYPKDKLEAARVDSLMLLIRDVKNRLAASSYPAQFGFVFDNPDATPPVIGTNTLQEVAGRCSSHLKGRLEKVDKILKDSSSGFVVGDKVSIADFVVFGICELLMSGKFEKVLKPKKVLDDTPALKAHWEKIGGLESVINWNKEEHKAWDGSDLSKKGIELLYFNLPGRTDCIRLSCREGNVEFKDIRIPFSLYGKIKGTDLQPFGQLPVLLVDGEPIAQAHAILRYIGRQSGLYTCDDHFQAAKIDEVMVHMEDILSSCYNNYVWVYDMANTKDLVKSRLCENFLTKVEIFDTVLKKNKNGVLYGDGVTMADFRFHACCVRAFRSIPALKEALGKYPNIKAHYEKIAKHDAITGYKKEDLKGGEKILKKGLELVTSPNVDSPIAWALRAGGKSFRDIRMNKAKISEMKMDDILPFGKLPVLFVDGEPISGSHSIERYVSRLCDNNHCPSKHYDAAVVDSLVDQCYDVFNPLIMYFYPESFGFKFDVSKSGNNAKKVVRERLTTIIKDNLSKFESALSASSSGYLVGDSPTIADVAFLDLIKYFHKDVLDHVDCKALLEEFPKAGAHHDKMMKLDAISAYYSQEHKGDGSEIQKKGLELAYFYGGGRGIFLRLAFALGNVAFRDLYIKGDDFKKAKADGLVPYNQLPVLYVDGAPIAQSFSILRYIGKVGGLYPTDDLLKAAKVDMFLDHQKDTTTPIYVSMGPKSMGWMLD